MSLNFDKNVSTNNNFETENYVINFTETQTWTQIFLPNDGKYTIQSFKVDCSDTNVAFEETR